MSRPQFLLIQNIKTLVTGAGFSISGGRKPVESDLGTLNGVDIKCDIASGSIIEIGKNLSIDHAQCVDGGELLGAPAWVDSHTHTIFAGQRAQEFLMRWRGETYQNIAAKGGGIHNTVRDTQAASAESLTTNLHQRLERMLRSGTGTVEIKTGYSDSAIEELRILRILNSFRQTVATSPTLPLISPTFLALHAVPKNKTEFDFVHEMIGALDTIQKEGLADHVDAFPEVGFFSLDFALEFARQAQARGLQAKIHCDELSDLRSSEYFISMGARSIDHLQKINKTAIGLLADAPTVATLMPATSFYLGLEYAGARRLIDAGACLALATDYNPGTAPSPFMSFTQMLAAKEFKMTTAEIFAASTFNAAKALGKEATLGTLETGKIANINLYRTSDLAELFCTWIEPEVVIQRSQVV